MIAPTESGPGIDLDRLARLAPLAALTPGRLAELASAMYLARAARGDDPIAALAGKDRTLFLLRGEILLYFAGGGSVVVVGGSGDGLHPLNRGQTTVVRSKAITDLELLQIDDDAVDIAITWNEAVAGGGAGRAIGEAARGEHDGPHALAPERADGGGCLRRRQGDDRLVDAVGQGLDRRHDGEPLDLTPAWVDEVDGTRKSVGEDVAHDHVAGLARLGGGADHRDAPGREEPLQVRGRSPHAAGGPGSASTMRASTATGARPRMMSGLTSIAAIAG